MLRTKIRIQIDPGRESGDSEERSASNERECADDSDSANLAQFARTSRSVERKVFEEHIESAAVEDESETGEQGDGAEEHVLRNRYLLVVLIETEEQDPEQDLHQVDGDIDGKEDRP